jgi:threonine dehydrogenase-like Zn-dependent dehydrogenase
MLLRTDMSIGISDATPPSLTHECAGKVENQEINSLSKKKEDRFLLEPNNTCI